MAKILPSFLLFGYVLLTPGATLAACSDDPMQDCADAVSDAQKSARETSDPLEKVQAAKEAVQTCVNCGIDAVKKGVNNLSASKGNIYNGN